MTRNLQPVTGMKDVLAAEIGAWQHVERTMAGVLAAYGYEEMRVPVVEHTDLFKRAIGEYTDVVEKEMYTLPTRAATASRCGPRPRRAWCAPRSRTACCAAHASRCGARARCSGTRSRRRAVIASSPRSTSKPSASRVRTWT